LLTTHGWHFERKCKILDNPLIPFYGRYIDNVFAIVYANSEKEALVQIENVKFDDCCIKWNVLDQYQAFLDMTLYIDEYNMLQYMPYLKTQSHQERIPQISHHPLDVKTGTFIGEMSRLATLSSTHSTYCNAIKSLAALYISRGYPSNHVYSWTKNNIQERWNKHLNNNKGQHDQVLVLKSEFNTAWDYFNVSELGKTIIEFWCDWIQHAKEGKYNTHFPQYTPDQADLVDSLPELCASVVDANGLSQLVPDICKLDFLHRRMIDSFKRTRNLFNLTNLRKNIVLSNMELHILKDNHNPPSYVDEDSDSSQEIDLFVQLLHNQGSVF
jgi:hypothetical protein